MAGMAVDKPAVNQAIFADATRLGTDIYPYVKMRSIQWHTALGDSPQAMQNALTGLGFTVAEASEIVQLVNDFDTLVAVFEGTNGTTYIARQMVPDIASVRGVS